MVHKKWLNKNSTNINGDKIIKQMKPLQFFANTNIN